MTVLSPQSTVHSPQRGTTTLAEQPSPRWTWNLELATVDRGRWTVDGGLLNEHLLHQYR